MFFVVVGSYVILVHVLMNKSLTRSISEDVDYIIILGSQLINQKPTSILHSRLEKGAELANQFPTKPVIVTGGRHVSSDPTEGAIMKEELVKTYQLDPARIIVEDQARNTFENFIYAKQLASLKKPVIVSSEFHSLRVAATAHYLNLNAIVIGANTPKNKRYKQEFREHLAIIKWIFVYILAQVKHALK